MLILYGILFVSALIGCRVRLRGFWEQELFSRPVTDSVKGLFIWLVFFTHFNSYVSYTSALDTAGAQINILLGQLVVAMFMLYSGYGISQAILKKGTAYVKGLPKNRLAKVLCHFAMAVVLFYPLARLMGRPTDLLTVVLSLVGWESLGNSNWYIFVILCLYAVSFLGYRLANKNPKLGLWLTTLLSLALLVFLRKTKPTYWYDTLLCYPLGLWIGTYKDKLVGFFTKSNARYLAGLLASLAVFVLTNTPHSIPTLRLAVTLINPLAFCCVGLFILLKVKIQNKWMVLSGNYLFEIYILQRIPMILCAHWGLSSLNHYLSFGVCFAATVLLAYGFRKLTNLVDKKVFLKKT